MGSVQGKHILLGVCGSVAAFKAADLASELTKAGADVRVVMTESAERFVTAETFAGLTGNVPATSLWLDGHPLNQGHIELARGAELIVVAPASAHSIAKAALGLADDMLSTVLLATHAPLVVAPAMESNMWEHAATQEHVAALKGRGVQIVGPVSGRLASGESGSGRMVEPEQILQWIDEFFRGEKKEDFSGVAICVSAGPTREPIDPVRYISNRSSGKMGYAIASAAANRGASVTLVSGPVDQALRDSIASSVDVVGVETAAEMAAAVTEAAERAQVVIMAAAVADYRVDNPSSEKVKNSRALTNLDLRPNADILAGLRESAPTAVRVGFAAETSDVVKHAQQKLAAKGVSLIVANDVSGTAGEVFGSDVNTATLIREGRAAIPLPRMAKADLAHRILDEVRDILAQKSGS